MITQIIQLNILNLTNQRKNGTRIHTDQADLRGFFIRENQLNQRSSVYYLG